MKNAETPKWHFVPPLFGVQNLHCDNGIHDIGVRTELRWRRIYNTARSTLPSPACNISTVSVISRFMPASRDIQPREHF